MIAKEITKIYEEYFRGNIDNFKPFKNPLKGELTVVISNAEIEIKQINRDKIINKINFGIVFLFHHVFKIL